jgi:hypothetical protein
MYIMMKAGSALVLSLALAAGAAAQKPMQRKADMPGMPSMGRGAATHSMPGWDTATVGTVRGVLTAIDTVASMGMGPGPGVHLTLREGSKTWPVHVGPASYVAKQKLRLKVGDRISVMGSRVVVSTVPTYIAARITRGAEVLELRDKGGLPLWRGMMMKARP